MDPAAEIGRNSVSKHQIQPEYGDEQAEIGRNSVSIRFSLSMVMSRLTRDRTAETVSREQYLRRERGQGNIRFSCSADHEQDRQNLNRLIVTLAISDYYYIYIHTN